MADRRETPGRRSKAGRAWRIGRDPEVAWIRENTGSGSGITSAIPPIFEADATVQLPVSASTAGALSAVGEPWLP